MTRPVRYRLPSYDNPTPIQNFILRRRLLGRTSTHGAADSMRAHNPDINIGVILNERNPIPHNPNGWVIRWGCVARTAPGANVLNSVEGIRWANNKRDSRVTLANAGLAPLSSRDLDEWRETGTYPCIVRPTRHAQGRNMVLCDTFDEVQQAANRFSRIFSGFYVSEYIPKVTEYRVFVGSGRVIWVAQKTPDNPEAIAWNVARGGRFDNIRWSDWPLDVVQCAVDVMEHTGLDFGGVDIMVDRDGRCYCLEVNSAPSQTSPYRQECTGKYFAYILEHGKDQIPVGEEGKYLRYIHPCLDDKAIIAE